jgi:outer membrane cobalamin receptor
MSNIYTQESVLVFEQYYDSTFEADPSLLKTIILDPIKPEQVQTIEVGYRGIVKKKLYVDMNAYYSVYKNFIGNIRVVQPGGDAQAGEESGTNAILTGISKLYQVAINAKQDVPSWGAGLGLAYYFSNKYSASINYTYSDIDTSKLTDPIIPGYNTPKNKINVGLKGNKFYKDMGFSINYQFVDKYRWESPFGDGNVPSYSLMDAQVSYEFSKINSIFRLGASNLLGKKYFNAYGGPTIGRIIYTTWTWEIK